MRRRRSRRVRRSLNVGCGRDVRLASDGWVNMDIAPLPGVDVIHSVTQFPWPFENGTFDHVYCSHIMEHVPHHLGTHAKDGFLLVMEEFHRILRARGTVEILGPHPESVDVWSDPTHTRIVHPKNFAYFDPASGFDYYTTAKFRVRTIEVTRRSPILESFLPMGEKRLGLTTHLAERIRFLRPLIYRRPWEMRVLLEKV